MWYGNKANIFNDFEFQKYGNVAVSAIFFSQIRRRDKEERRRRIRRKHEPSVKMILAIGRDPTAWFQRFPRECGSSIGSHQSPVPLVNQSSFSKPSHTQPTAYSRRYFTIMLIRPSSQPLTLFQIILNSSTLVPTRLQICKLVPKLLQNMQISSKLLPKYAN